MIFHAAAIATGRNTNCKNGGWRILNRQRRLWVAFPLRFCFVQRVGHSLLRFDQPSTMRLSCCAGGLPPLMTS